MKRIQFIFTFLFIVQVFCQHQDKVDFIRSNIIISLDINEKSLKGRASYEFDVISNVDSIFLDAVNMDFSKINLDGKEVKFDYRDNKVVVDSHFKQDTAHKLTIEYSCKPKQTLYFIGYDDEIKGNEQVWTQGQGKYTSHWVPSFDDMNEKLEFDIELENEVDNQIFISNGQIGEVAIYHDNGAVQNYNMTRPMSSYLAAFAIGDFDKKTMYSKSGVPIELYYEPKDSLKFEPTYRYSKEIFDFLEEEIGVSYPWQNYKQVPVQDFLYAGMENTTCTIFSNQYMIDSTAFIDKNYVNVNAHELAHQWFGNMVTEQSGDHHWLHEGFATYYAYLTEQQLFGDDYMYWKMHETAKTLHNLSENGDGEALTNPNANSLTFYEKGAWAVTMLREQIGDLAFKKGIQNYLEKYAYSNVTISNFLDEMQKTSNQNLRGFRDKWLESEEFPWLDVKQYLNEKSTSLKTYFELHESFKENLEPFDSLIKLWDNFDSDNLKSEVIKDFGSSLAQPYFMDKIKKESPKVRQAMLLATDSIPAVLKEEFEVFLSEPSYISQEAALFKLWQAFPEDRLTYLEITSSLTGLPNKNVRLLWLTLALITPEYQSQNKKVFYDELNGYTNKYYNFEVRQLAFQYLSQIQALNDQSIKNLLAATDHHVWQFKKSSRNLVRNLATGDKAMIDRILKSLPEEEQIRINKIIAP